MRRQTRDLVVPFPHTVQVSSVRFRHTWNSLFRSSERHFFSGFQTDLYRKFDLFSGKEVARSPVTRYSQITGAAETLTRGRGNTLALSDNLNRVSRRNRRAVRAYLTRTFPV